MQIAVSADSRAAQSLVLRQLPKKLLRHCLQPTSFVQAALASALGGVAVTVAAGVLEAGGRVAVLVATAVGVRRPPSLSSPQPAAIAKATASTTSRAVTAV